ncbi:MAG: fumarylacetoacetate hydrolase family protein [Zoogloeaceae bacterium]|nr:fumarylacetoacetate hydrolase family protein [Rhodocyclaceae bacterium]MCP5236447.1 fumarylacetoacetate hydrolase family protein [Zoogloeaceae bacterium]
MEPIFEAIVPTELDVVGDARKFQVRRVFCVARNYAAHAREMGQDPAREPPFFFTKPADAVFPVADDGSSVWPYPLASRDVHHEFELVVALGSGGIDLDLEQARCCVWAYAPGLDMTRRDLQAEAKKAGRPWDVAKAFDASAPVGPLTPVAACGWLDRGSIALEVDGEVRQRGDLADMIWSIPEVIATLSGLFELKAGDLIFTGTPEGVGPVVAGNRLAGRIDGLPPMRLTIGPRDGRA